MQNTKLSHVQVQISRALFVMLGTLLYDFGAFLYSFFVNCNLTDEEVLSHKSRLSQYLYNFFCLTLNFN
jgi:hypothetical protein